jgi:hypothetical protein
MQTMTRFPHASSVRTAAPRRCPDPRDGASAAVAAGPNTSFGFNARDISGCPNLRRSPDGGGAFNSSTGPPTGRSSFSCTSPVTANGLLDDVRRERAFAGTATRSCRTRRSSAGDEPVANTVSTSADTVVRTPTYRPATEPTSRSKPT